MRNRRRRRWITITATLALLSALAATTQISPDAGNGALQPRGRSAPAAAELEIAATGDVTLGRVGSYPAGGPKQLLGRVSRELRAPLSLGNLETTLVDPAARLPNKCGAASTDCFAFGAPETFAQGLRAVGFTILNLANNHTNDYGAGRTYSHHRGAETRRSPLDREPRTDHGPASGWSASGGPRVRPVPMGFQHARST